MAICKEASQQFADKGTIVEALLVFVPVVLAGYTAFSTRIWFDYLGQLDFISYVLLFMTCTYAILTVRNGALRGAMLFILVVLNIFLSWGSLIYFRHFGTFAPVEALGEIRSARIAAEAVPLLVKWPDYIFMLAMPVGALIAAVRMSDARPKGALNTLKLAALFCLAFLVHWEQGREYSYKIGQINPLVNLPRQAIVKMVRNNMLEGLNDVSGMVSPADPSYVSCKDPDYPLLKKPVADRQPLYEWKGTRPNVVLIIVESLQASEMGAYNGGRKSYTPNLDRMASQGLLFKNFYNVGMTSISSEYSMLASNYPGSALKGVENARVLGFPALLQEAGYETIFVTGIREDFKINLRRALGMSEIYVDLPEEHKKSYIGFGWSDEDILSYALDVFSNEAEPFFGEVFTLSSHTSFFRELPGNFGDVKADGDDRYIEYINGYLYTDHAIGKFIEEARKRPFFDNTIFIFTGDHGAQIGARQFIEDPIRFNEWYRRSPLIVYAPLLIGSGLVNTVSSQVDIGPTILDMLGIQAPNTFVGASLLREHAGQRPIYMSSFVNGRESIRIGDEYCMYIGDNPDARKHGSLLDSDGAYACFHVGQDILESADVSKLSPLSAARRGYVMSTLKNTRDLNMYLIYNDKIVPPGGIGNRCPNN